MFGLKQMIKEPLLHFLLIGIMLFVASNFLSSAAGDNPDEIIITQGQIDHLTANFAQTRQRSPTPDELKALIQDRIREEVYYREAIALGLDKDDTVIRRRLRQKMEFLSEDTVTHAEPTDTDLNDYLAAHPDFFRVESRFTFHQLYLNPEKHGENLAQVSAELLAQLNQAGGQADVSAQGDSLLLEHQFDSIPASEVAKLFGEKFAIKLEELAPARWHGPVESGYGVHLVWIGERIEGHLPVLADVREIVRREWENSQRLKANEKFYQDLLVRYQISIEDRLQDAEKLAAKTE